MYMGGSGGGGRGSGPHLFGPRYRFFNIGPKVGPPPGPPFFACKPKMDPASVAGPLNIALLEVCDSLLSIGP